jgi:hypothetical protein
VELDLDVTWPEGQADRLGSYTVVGPRRAIAMLKQANVGGSVDGNMSGKLAPIQPLSLDVKLRPTLGIPEDATHVCFAYPAPALEEELETLDLADERWAFFLLVGGFCYFAMSQKPGSSYFTTSGGERHDAGLKLIQCNALVLVPSDVRGRQTHRPVGAMDRPSCCAGSAAPTAGC